MITTTDWLDGPLQDNGFDNLREATEWARATGRTPSELAKHLGVSWRRLNAELRANDVRLPSVGTQMLAAAREHVAAGQSLKDCPPDMRRWFHTLLRPRTGGQSGDTYGHLLDELDPGWRNG